MPTSTQITFMQGVTITTPRKKELNAVDQALLDIKEGRVHKAESLDDLFNQLDA